jgi:hypothetical protein
VNCGIDRLETVILEALLLITQSKMYGDVALDSNIEKRSSFRSGLRNEELMRVYPGNKIECSEHCCRVKDSLRKAILDSRIGGHQEEPWEHSTLF